ncbi:MAG: putative ABC transporter permease [Patescibacteria group bacterium]
MSIFLFVLSFFIYSFIGWILDTSTRSWIKKRYTTGSFFPIPFCPIYGFGALFVILLHNAIDHLPFLVEGFIFGIFLSLFEFISGKLIFIIFKRRLWKYEDTGLSIGHWTDASHAVLWGILSLLLVTWIHPFLTSLVLR